MRDFGIRAFWVVVLASTAVLPFALRASADGCTFRGEIVDADDYGKIVIERADRARSGEALGPHAPLYPGDMLLVRGDQIIWIRDEPGGELREVDAGDGRVTIGQPQTCEVRDGFKATLGGFFRSLAAILEGPVADQPVVTHPVRGEAGREGLKLAFQETQLLTNDLETLSVHWTGLDANVVLRSTVNNVVHVSASTVGAAIIEEALDHSLKAGDGLRLELSTKDGRLSRAVRVVSRDDLPKPEGVESLDGLSSTEAAIYAIWLATEGPPEWRLQGFSLLSQAARDDYMAWKVLRALRAEDPE